MSKNFKKTVAFPCVSLIIGKILSLTPSGKRRIISVRNPVMLKRMKMQPATKTAAKAASYGKPRPKQMVKVKNAFVPIPPVEKSSTYSASKSLLFFEDGEVNQVLIHR